MTNNIKDLFLNALKKTNQARPPIWFMRQAGRYLPSYRALKKGRSLYEMFHNPQTIVDVTLLPIEPIGVDAAILFSDILTVLDGLGQKYTFEEGRGPVITNPLRSISQLEKREAFSTYRHISDAIEQLKKELSIPLIGFAGAPFTVATYLIEDARSSNMKQAKKWIFEDPKGFSAVIDAITDATIEYLNVQIEAGVEAIQLFDSWANVLAMREFRQFALAPMQKIIQAVAGRVPVIVFCRGSSFLCQELNQIGADAISIDYGAEMGSVRKLLGADVALQGNLDPMVLYGDEATIRRGVDPILAAMHKDPAFIFNLGHGLLPDIDHHKVRFLVDYVHEQTGPALHKLPHSG